MRRDLACVAIAQKKLLMTIQNAVITSQKLGVNVQWKRLDVS